MKFLSRFSFPLAVIALALVILGAGYYSARGNVSRLVSCSTAAATTTLKYMSKGLATTTKICLSERADSMELQIFLVASSSPVTLDINMEWSHNGIDWFGEDTIVVTEKGRSHHASSTLVHRWNPTDNGIGGATATSTRVIKSQNMGAEYTRFTFSIPGDTGSNNAAFHARALFKEQEVEN